MTQAMTYTATSAHQTAINIRDSGCQTQITTHQPSAPKLQIPANVAGCSHFNAPNTNEISVIQTISSPRLNRIGGSSSGTGSNFFAGSSSSLAGDWPSAGAKWNSLCWSLGLD